MTKISVTQVSNYEQTYVNAAVKTHFERFQLEQKLTPETKVLLKPNLLMKRTPEEFTTTHPAVVEAVIIWLKSVGVKNITLADSPGGPYHTSALKNIYQASGMTKVCERHGVALNYDTSFREVPVKNGKLVSKFPIITPVCEADFIIDLCKLKTHAMTGLSGAVKNLFGTIPGLTKPKYHAQFPDKAHFCSLLIDLCETVSPDFILVDAIQAMEGNGPSGGTKRDSGLLISSTNPYELDYFLCKLIGADPEKILTVKESVKRGLCCTDMSKVDVVGDFAKLSPFILPKEASPDFSASMPKILRKPLTSFVNTFLAAKPRIVADICIGCGKCAESCPENTIRIVDKKAKVNYHRCIRCFCCHEMCPVKAIEIRR